MNVRPNKVAEGKEELERLALINGMELERARMRKKAEYYNLRRCLNDQRREEEEYANNVQTKENAALLKQRIQQEQRLVTAIEEYITCEVENVSFHPKTLYLYRIELEDEMKFLPRQLLRQNSPELQELERKLRNAYIAKQQIAQIAEKEAIKLNEKLREKESHEILQSSWYKENEYYTLKKEEDIRNKAKYRQELQNQMILEERNRKFAYEEFLREKKLIDDIVQRIHDERGREIEERMCKMKRTQQEIDAFKQAQEIWKQKKREEIVEENRKIQEYLLSKASDIRAKQLEKEQKVAAREKLCEGLAKKVYEAQYSVHLGPDLQSTFKVSWLTLNRDCVQLDL
ncbi:hypothetical protein FQR65_LT10420 [Abscondita terminalis]|nr:hypothetical protein FQR65_LT10420 [Abscondita terminalis]